MAELDLHRDFEARHGESVSVAPGVRRVTAPNGGPFTFTGTNSYIVGRGRVAIIDPGPVSEAHLNALLAATRGETVTHIIVTHTHRDHSDGVPELVRAVEAPVFGPAGPMPVRQRVSNDATVDAGYDRTFTPDTPLADSDLVSGDDWQLEVVATPGHASNHLAFALAGSDILFSGDHVMGWSTTVVAPPDGSMAHYMASLDRLLAREEETYLPGHGGPISGGRTFTRALRAHRLRREADILRLLSRGEETISALVARLYSQIDPRLLRAASLSVFAHLEDLTERGAVENIGAPGLDGTFRISSR